MVRNPAIEEEILLRIREGESLVSICKDSTMPSPRIVYSWLEEDEGFRHNYARAREDQAERYAEQIVSIGEDVNHRGVTMEEIQVARLRIDARKWIASKLLPKKYGEKGIEVHTNSTSNNFTVSVEQLKDWQARRKATLTNGCGSGSNASSDC